MGRRRKTGANWDRMFHWQRRELSERSVQADTRHQLELPEALISSFETQRRVSGLVEVTLTESELEELRVKPEAELRVAMMELINTKLEK